MRANSSSSSVHREIRERLRKTCAYTAGKRKERSVFGSSFSKPLLAGPERGRHISDRRLNGVSTGLSPQQGKVRSLYFSCFGSVPDTLHNRLTIPTTYCYTHMFIQLVYLVAQHISFFFFIITKGSFLHPSIKSVNSYKLKNRSAFYVSLQTTFRHIANKHKGLIQIAKNLIFNTKCGIL